MCIKVIRKHDLRLAQLGETIAVAEQCPVSKLMTSVRTTISARVEWMA